MSLERRRGAHERKIKTTMEGIAMRIPQGIGIESSHSSVARVAQIERVQSDAKEEERDEYGNVEIWGGMKKM